MYFTINDDTFCIAKRIKDIDKNYSIKYNTLKHRFEVWYRDGISEHLEIVLPYECLDLRTLKKVQESKVSKIDAIMQEISENNEKKQAQANLQLQDELNFKVASLVKQQF